VSDSTEAVQLASTHLYDAIALALPASPAASRSACHESGLIPVVDDVRSAVLTSGPHLGIGKAEVQQLALLYVTAEDFQGLIDGDNGRFTAGLRAAGVPLSGGDPVAATFHQFEWLARSSWRASRSWRRSPPSRAPRASASGSPSGCQTVGPIAALRRSTE
jgi:hypothetical protein